MFEFSTTQGMEDELEPMEMCVAKIPNKEPIGFTHNVGLVYKDEYGDVYSMPFQQHNGTLQETMENHNLLKERRNATKEPESSEIPGGERTGSVQEVRQGEQGGGSDNVKPTTQSNGNNENQRQHPPRKNPKGGKKAKRKKKVKKGKR